MKYVIFPVSANRPANYTAPDSTPVYVDTLDDAVNISTPLPVLTSLDGYTPIVDPSVLPAAKAAAVTRANGAFFAGLSAGIAINGIVLDGTPGGQDMMSKALTALNLLKDLGQYNDAAVMSDYGLLVVDIAGASHDMTALAFKQLCVGYLQAIGELRGTMITQLAAIAAATTVAAVEAIV